MKYWLALIGVTGLLAACSSAATPTAAPTIQAPAGYRAEVFAAGLSSPTQMIVGPRSAIWVAQLNGEENAGQGQIIEVRAGSNDWRVIADRLFKPTGLAILSDTLWIASGRDVLRSSISPAGTIGPIEKVLENLPFNGRSEGTLTASPAGRLIFETSGQRLGDAADKGSAQLWELNPLDAAQPRVIAVGLKNAYAHMFDAQSRLWVTDVADDPVNGGPPPDELNLIVAGENYGWPRCYGDRQPALNYHGAAEECAATRSSVATFPPHSTPVSVVPSPWEANTLLVALWGPANPAVMRVAYTLDDDNARAQEITLFITGLTHPQHLLVLSDGSLLVSDFETGVIYRIIKMP